NEVLIQLKLERVVYVGQDWGGPVGMGALALLPGMLEGAVIMNTALNAPKEEMDISRVHAIVKTPIVGELATEVLLSLFDQLAGAQGDPASLPPEIIDLYKRPVHDSGNIKAPLTMMRMVSDGPNHPSSERMRFVEAYVGTLDIPVEIVWGMRDPVLGKALPFMQQNFPDARVTKTEAGHFLQEEVPVEIAAAILRVVDKVAASKDAMEAE
ncbi:MAG: hypothetical protein KUG59_05595, partial [Parvibaculaceae bacterium]|nr:hypothetical protein [Parvibaculaceae bacterium]